MKGIRHISGAISLAIALALNAPGTYAQMTDEQALVFIQQQSKSGKTEKQIGEALLAKGVTPDQAKRLKSKYSPSARMQPKPQGRRNQSHALPR
jgi:hypothetical protein